MFLRLIRGVVHVSLPMRPLVQLGVKDQVGMQHFSEDRDAVGSGLRNGVDRVLAGDVHDVERRARTLGKQEHPSYGSFFGEGWARLANIPELLTTLCIQLTGMVINNAQFLTVCRRVKTGEIRENLLMRSEPIL